MNANQASAKRQNTDFDHTDSSVPASRVREIYREMRENCPVAHSDKFGGVDYISRHADVRAVLSDSITFTSGEGVFIPDTGLPRVPPMEYDPPTHTMLRAIMDGPLCARAVRAFEPTIAEIVNILIDDFAERGRADLAADLSEPLPAIVIGRMVGLDQDEAVEVRRIAITLFDSIGTPKFPTNLQAFVGFNEDQLAKRRAHPREDYLTALAHGQVEGVPVEPEMVTGIMTAYLLGGHHSTATGIAGLMRHVLSEPGLRDRVATQDKLLSRVIEESLRLTTPLQLFARTVHDDVEVGDAKFGEGDRLMMSLAAANRDPRQFSNPDRFDPDRSRNPHVAFGGGLHSCQGQHIARAEMRLALRTLLARLPDVHLAGEVVESGLTGGTLMAVTSVPVAFSPERRSR